MQRAFTAVVLVALGCVACATVERPQADTRLAEAQDALDQGLKLQAAGQYAEALPLFERARELREVALGGTHPEVAHCLQLLGDLHRLQGDYARATSLGQRALSIQEEALGKHHPDVAKSLNLLGLLYADQGLYAQAEPLYERALAIREAALGKDHLDVATTLSNLAIVYKEQGLYEKAELLNERTLALREAALGKHHPKVATTLNNLALVYMNQGLYTQAEPLYERALAIWEEALGKDHPYVSMTLSNLAILYRDLGFYSRAVPLLERALAISEKAFGKTHPDVAASLNNLADIYAMQGLYERAMPLYERTLAIAETVLGKDNPHVADLLDNIASLFHLQQDYSRAEPLLERALAIRKTVLGPQHRSIGDSLLRLGLLYKDQGLYAQAAPLLERTLEIHEAALGKNHSDVASSLYNLANLYVLQGDYARAEPLYQRALAIWEALFGRNHPDVAQPLTGLAELRLAQGNLSEALSLFERAMTISEQHLRQEVFGFSEARMASVLQLRRKEEESLYDLARAHPDNARVRHLALSTALLRKGRSVEELAYTSRIVYRGLGQADREAFERLRGLRTRFASLSLAGPGELPLDKYQQQLKELAEQGDALEEQVSRSSEPLRTLYSLPPPAQIVERVAAALPRDGVLVEFVAYKAPSELRYLALLLFGDGSTGAVDLGPAEPIDRAALRLNGALAQRSASYQPAARALYHLAFRPLVPLLGKQFKQLYLSPDSQLALVPFAALHDGRNLLVDAFDITYLTSGKDLLPRPAGISPPDSAVLLADPDFESLSEQPSPTTEAASVLSQRTASLDRFFSSVRSDLADHPWPPLPGTRKEAEAIQRLIPGAQVLLGDAATKEALLTLTTPGILHIATHGFFLEDASTPAGTRAVGSIGAVAEAGPQSPPEPLLRSGLVLAGAHASAAQPGSRREDSLVTALELAGLDLWGTQLVVLSACDTGKGDVKLGQGVYGLRRALVAAGAETLVTSLWKVNDATTEELMVAYYRNLLAGQGRSAALRTAMRSLRQKQPHPHFWAPFIALGKNAPLQGFAPRTQALAAP